MTVIERYEALKAKVVNRKEEFMRLTEFMEKETDYLYSPASTRFHGSYEGGLLEHSLNVYDCLKDYLKRERCKNLYKMAKITIFLRKNIIYC